MAKRHTYHGYPLAFGGPIISKESADANLRQQVAGALDGRYMHPSGGVIRTCDACAGYGVRRLDNGFSGMCPDCDGSGMRGE